VSVTLIQKQSHCRSFCHESLSDCEDDPAEGAALNQVTQSFSRFGSGKVLATMGLIAPD